MRVLVELDLDISEHAAILRTMIPPPPPQARIAEFVRHLLGTAAGREILAAAVRNWRPGDVWSRGEMATQLNQEETAVFAKIRVLGRPAAKWGMPIFQPGNGNEYSLSAEMHGEISRQLEHEAQAA